jgi:hypothetical protein
MRITRNRPVNDRLYALSSGIPKSFSHGIPFGFAGGKIALGE